ncbi:hypothetical protein LINGRAHAP2_LOCUS32096 [Linum grandiflorum]
MEGSIEFVVYYGGSMVSGVDGPNYDGGQVTEVGLARDALSYLHLLEMCTKDLDYSYVDRMFYIVPGTTVSDGVTVIVDDTDVAAVIEASKIGVVSLFIEGIRIESFMADNEDVSSDLEKDSALEGEYSAVAANVGVVHFLSDSDRTSDEEFQQSMMDLGVGHRRRVKANVFADGIEVEQLNEVSVNQARPEVIAADGAPVDDQ